MIWQLQIDTDLESLEFTVRLDVSLENKLILYIYIFNVLHELFNTVLPGDVPILIAFQTSNHIPFALWH